MAIILVTYDLNRPGKDYSKIIGRIKQLTGTWCHAVESLWLLKMDATATQVRDDLQTYRDGNDELLVIDITGDAAAWIGLSQQVSDWLKANL